jgi:putative lipoprotein
MNGGNANSGSRRMVWPTTWLAILLAPTALVAQEIRDRNLPAAGAELGRGVGESRYLAPSMPAPGAFKLGIYGRNTETGVQVTQVLPSSVAQRAGLETGDVIVNVAGYQVGLLEGRLFDLGDELARRVDGFGRANLLVRNRRDGQLVNVRVQFTPAWRVISATIQTRDRVPLPSTAVLKLRLLDITRPQWRDVVIAQQETTDLRRWPVLLRLEIDPTTIRANHRYALDAQVTDRGRTMLQTAAPLPVLLSASGDQVELWISTAAVRPPTGIVPYDQISQWYQQYLGRPPTGREMSAWQSDLDQGKTLTEVQAGILSSSEFFDRQQGDRDRYVDEVYRLLRGAGPTPQQRQKLREQLERQGDVRHRFLQELLRERNEP